MKLFYFLKKWIFKSVATLYIDIFLDLNISLLSLGTHKIVYSKLEKNIYQQQKYAFSLHKIIRYLNSCFFLIGNEVLGFYFVAFLKRKIYIKG